MTLIFENDSLEVSQKLVRDQFLTLKVTVIRIPYAIAFLLHCMTIFNQNLECERYRPASVYDVRERRSRVGTDLYVHGKVVMTLTDVLVYATARGGRRVPDTRRLLTLLGFPQTETGPKAQVRIYLERISHGRLTTKESA